MRAQSPKIIKMFDKAAAFYDSNAAIQREAAVLLMERLKRPPITSILEIGAGSGLLTEMLASEFSSPLYAIDASNAMLELAKRRVQRDNVHFIKADMDKLEERAFDEDAFGLIISNAALHWSMDLSRILQLSQRWLAPEGLFAFTYFGPGTFFELRSLGNINTYSERFLPFEDLLAWVNDYFIISCAEKRCSRIDFGTLRGFLRYLRQTGTKGASAVKRSDISRFKALEKAVIKEYGSFELSFEIFCVIAKQRRK